MRRYIWAPLLLVACPQLAAQDADAQAAGAAYDKLSAEYQTSYDAWMEKYRAASQAGEQKKAQQLIKEQPGPEFVDRFLAGAQKFAGTDGALPFLIWSFQNSRDDTERDYVLSILSLDHVESAQLDQVVPRARNKEFLDRVIAKTPHDEVKAQAMYARANTVLGAEATDVARKAAIADLVQVKELTKDKRLADRIDGVIFEAKNLAVGMAAPEIEAEDLDGVNFKLSDYRGKVVLLDFWGDW